jgi:hypothetical protein
VSRRQATCKLTLGYKLDQDVLGVTRSVLQSISHQTGC